MYIDIKLKKAKVKDYVVSRNNRVQITGWRSKTGAQGYTYSFYHLYDNHGKKSVRKILCRMLIEDLMNIDYVNDNKIKFRDELHEHVIDVIQQLRDTLKGPMDIDAIRATLMYHFAL